MCACTRKVLELVFLIMILFLTSAQVEVVAIELKPMGPTEYRVMELGEDNTRRRLSPYQLCLLCKCCAASNTTCVTIPCCFGIDCQLPNKPFGVCAFVPKTCNCTSCAA